MKTDQIPTFEESAKAYLSNTQLRRNIGHATHTIREKRLNVVSEMSDWEALREAGNQIKNRVMRHLDDYLLQLEASVERAGGTVHWARDAEEANRIVTDLVKQKGVSEVVKVKSITTDEIKLNKALADEGIQALETDLAEILASTEGDQ